MNVLGTAAQLFLGFFRAAIVGYGGGPAIIPLIEYEVVDRYGWLTQEEFAQALVAGNMLPGPIATKVAGFVGYRVGGALGALSALLATVAPTVLLMILLLGVLTRFSNTPVVKGMLRAVRPVVWTLFILLAVDYIVFVKSLPAAAVAAAAFVLIYFVKLHPALVMAAALVLGGAFWR